MDSLKYIELLFPNGRAFESVEDQKIYNKVLALQIDRVLSWIQDFQDQIWYVNDNFDPEPWEKRYNIDVPELATLPERRQVVKSYMSFPQSQNRLSLDFIQSQLTAAGFTDIVVSTNESGAVVGKLHGNNITDTENYLVGSESYNTIKITGTIQSYYYYEMLLLLMSIKPLDTAVYDDINFYLSLSYDETLALALNENLTLAFNTI
jgi:hypothetical protein